MKFVTLEKEEFNQFALTHKNANLWQSLDMAELREKDGFVSEFVGVKENEQILCAAFLSYRSIQLGYRQYSSPRGFLIDFNDKELLNYFIQELKLFLKKRKALYLNVDPYIAYKERNLSGELVEGGFDHSYVINNLKACGFKHHGFTNGIDLTREPRWIYTILLDKDEKALLNSFERKCKRSVMKTIKYKISTKELDKNTIDEFVDVMEATSKRRDFDNRTRAYYLNLLDTFGKRGHLKYLSAILDIDNFIASVEEDKAEEQKIIDDCDEKLKQNPKSSKMNNKKKVAMDVVSRYDKHIEEAIAIKNKVGKEIVLSSGVFFIYGNEILCLFSGVYEEYMQFASPYAMHWQMMKYGIENNISRYNLYGISGIFDPSAEDYGVYEFKKGFNGEVVELVGDFKLEVSPFMNKVYNILRKFR